VRDVAVPFPATLVGLNAAAVGEPYKARSVISRRSPRDRVGAARAVP
jgi:hypothetical protein